MLEIHNDIKQKLNNFLKNNNVPHILFHGPHGSGKKTLVYNFIKSIYPDKNEYNNNVLTINCAIGKGIQFIREDIKQFAKCHIYSKNNFKSIILHNADKLTVDAQSALRRCVELFSNTTRFFIIIESKRQLLRPIISRFCEIYVYYPYIEDKTVNMHIINKRNHETKCVKYEEYMKNRNILFNKTMLSINETTNLFNIVNEMYEKGFSCYDIINHYKTSDDIKILFNTVKSHFKNEQMLMYFILFKLFRSKENLEIFELIT